MLTQSSQMHTVLHHRGQSATLLSEDWLRSVEYLAISAVIFDCDGTLVDSAAAHLKCMQAAAEEQGFVLTEDWYHTRTGLDRRGLMTAFRTTTGADIDVNRACEKSMECFGAFVHLVQPIAPVVAFASALRQRGIPLAVATNAERIIAEQSLNSIGQRHLFDTVASVSDGVSPKPSPDVFDLAARRLGVPPEKTLVLEDSPQGVTGALASGASVMQLVHDT